ncbi:MAG: glycosyltransferase [Cetobacterium sp.]
MNIEVLVATMNQKDISLYEKMNLKTDAIISNQGQDYFYQEIIKNNKKIKFISNREKGVGKNRNQALLYGTGDIYLFADDDMQYVDNYENIIRNAFKKLPKADIIIFNIEILGDEIRSYRINKRIKKLNKFNVLNYGAARIAIKRKEQLKKNLWFSLLYGGGALYSSGEDSLFLIEALNKGMKIYAYPEKIAIVSQETSTWFNGYTQKYFEDKGYWLANAFRMLHNIIAIYFSFKFKKNNKIENFNVLKIYLFLKKGIKKFKYGDEK